MQKRHKRLLDARLKAKREEAAQPRRPTEAPRPPRLRKQRDPQPFYLWEIGLTSDPFITRFDDGPPVPVIRRQR